ncbi:hypothetical protein HMPREF0971_00913 [Segatella oris F0302]|uniref:Uncharacterized protein n=1 Tax=Segatella oris F0302 TaxID=649760 RepID=D1QPM2_9BACT|nr:hypothetical protein HMPREF0971_00913 [Segatella oris F0302]
MKEPNKRYYILSFLRKQTILTYLDFHLEALCFSLSMLLDSRSFQFEG